MSTSESLETAFASVENAAATAAKSATAMSSVAKQLQRAAQLGDIPKIQRLLERLGETSSTFRQDVSNAKSSWHLSDQDIEDYLTHHYEQELIDQAQEAGLVVRRQDDRLVAYPSLLKVLPIARVMEIDRKRVPILRPSRLVMLLLANQQKKPSTKPEQFLEILHHAYRLVTGGSLDETVALTKVYDALTMLPAARKEYAKPDFTRDLYTLDISDVTRTRSGISYSLPASTGTKSARGVLSFVSAEGETINYFGIRFSEVN
ncbi:MAG: hypothetical protein WCP28_05060 [Actinomycetes bacterium]